MATRKRITISWSGGKDSALALQRLNNNKEFEIVHLHCVIGENTRRVGLHGVREELIELQAAAIGLPLVKGYLKESESNHQYEGLVKSLYARFRDEGITHIMFGDIFLEDLKEYRERLLKESGLIPVYPLWTEKSEHLLQEFLSQGFKTVICACNDLSFHAGLLGRTIDMRFLDDVPPGIDPCGENGEFHSFVYEAPYFKRPVGFTLGDQTVREYTYQVKNGSSVEVLKSTFHFQELLP
jgi:uncharacterized protein (TIGR00290 family)